MKIAVLLSGGVDSSMALHLLKQQGQYELTAFYLKIWLEDDLAYLGDCPWEDDLKYARAVCEQLNVPLRVVALQTEYHEKVVSHTIFLPDNSRKTLGLIYPGKFHFGTDAAERMEIVAGECHVKLDGENSANPTAYGPGEHFEVPAKSGFDIEVRTGICEYVCSFLP